MRSVVVPAAVAAALMLVGCSEQTGAQPELKIDQAPSAGSAPEESGPASPRDPRSHDGTSRDGGVRLEAGSLPDRGADQAAAEAYVDYLEVRAHAFNTVRVDLAGLSAVAVGEALQDVQGGVAYRSREKLHMVGGLGVDVTDVVTQGRTARVTACLANSTAEANRAGKVVESDPPPFYRSRAQLRRFGADVWLVSTVEYAEVTGC